MKPGPELDALIAKEVMGWKDGGLVSTTGDLDPRTWATGIELPRIPIPPGMSADTYFHKNPMPRFKRPILLRVEFCPSTDIAAAWEVVEKLQDRFRTVVTAFEKYGFGCHMKAWDSRIEIDVQSEADSAPHAICLAALRAVGFTG